MKNEMGFFLEELQSKSYSCLTNSFLLSVTLEASKLCCSRVLRRLQRDKHNRQFICKIALKSNN
jgi:hypothetical protein